MSDLIRDYRDFLDELRADYLSRGYRIVSADDISPQLSFRPDLAVTRDGEITLIEVKSASRLPPARINELRQRAEQLGYRFELKVVPRAPNKRKRVDHMARVPGLLSDARTFFDANRFDLALILGWIAFEITVRVLYARSSNASEPVTATGDIIRAATDLELISEDDLPDIRAIGELRNRVVHGFETEIPRPVVDRAIELANRIAKEAELVGPESRI